MKNKHYLQAILGLVILNIITISIILIKPDWLVNNEKVATIGKESISRQEWLNELEIKYGKNTLKDLINQKVVEQMAKKYDITVDKKEIDREMTILKTTSYVNNLEKSEERLKQQIKYNLLLEEIITKDAVVSEEEMKQYYQNNQYFYVIPESYLVSQIIVKTKADAEETLKELEQGSNFSVLAMERSIDRYSSEDGGNIGYVNEYDSRVSSAGLQVLRNQNKGEWTEPFEVSDGYAIYLLHDKISEKEYAYKEVKKQIRRQIALDQMHVAVSADVFWKEAKVDWFYNSK